LILFFETGLFSKQAWGDHAPETGFPATRKFLGVCWNKSGKAASDVPTVKRAFWRNAGIGYSGSNDGPVACRAARDADRGKRGKAWAGK
jgi:hypothetical protein